MPANKRRARTPIEVKVTIANSLFSDARNKRILELDRNVVERSELLLSCIAEGGKTLTKFFDGHAAEGSAKLAVLEPLKRDADALVTLLNHISHRFRMVTPPTSVDEFEAAVALQLDDVDEAAQSSVDRAQTEGELEHLVSLAYVELSTASAAMEEAAQTLDRSGASNGGVSPDDSSLVGTLKRSAKKHAEAADKITAWRRQHAARGYAHE